MEFTHIKKKSEIDQDRHMEKSGYINHKDEVRLEWSGNSNVHVSFNGRYNSGFMPFFRKAIDELMDDIINKAYELEEEYYKEVSLKAKQEAANILAGEDIIPSKSE